MMMTTLSLALQKTKGVKDTAMTNTSMNFNTMEMSSLTTIDLNELENSHKVKCIALQQQIDEDLQHLTTETMQKHLMNLSLSK